MRHGYLLVGFSGNGRCADNESVRRPHVQLGRVICFTAGDDTMAATIRSAKQTQFVRSNVAQSMTGKPYSSIPSDLWIEMTMNKGSKVKAGWLSIVRNEKQLMADTRNANNIGRVRAVLRDQVRTRNVKRTLNALRHECA